MQRGFSSLSSMPVCLDRIKSFVDVSISLWNDYYGVHGIKEHGRKKWNLMKQQGGKFHLYLYEFKNSKYV